MKKQAGFTLIEALVALLVMAAGMMSFAVLQGRLRANSDVSKQRSEATRLAQEDMENLRSYGIAGATAGGINGYASITAGASTKTVLASNVSASTNAVFTVARTVTDSAVANMKDLRVTVAWTNRNGDPETVVLRSIISKSDPAIAASLAISPNGSPIRDLLGRDIQVPIPAKSLGDGTSAIKPLAAGTFAYVFDNDTGIVTKRCTGLSSTLVTNSLTNSDLPDANCTNISGGYLLTGFVRFSTGAANTVSATSANDPIPSSGSLQIRMDMDNTAITGSSQGLRTLLNASGPWPTMSSAVGTTIGSNGTTYSASPECSAEALQTVTYTSPVSYSQVNNGVTQNVTATNVVAIIPQSVTTISSATIAPWVGVTVANAATQIVGPAATGEKYVGYTCLVYSMNLDGDTTTPNAWTGRSTIWPTGWTIGGTSSGFKVCRYSSDYDLDAIIGTDNGIWRDNGTIVTKIDNSENPYAHLNVQRSLSNQNFLVIRGDNTCPSGSVVEVNGQGSENYTNTTTVTHQP